MDPLSQGVLGAVAALAVASPQRIRLAALAGCVGGMIADLDTLIGSENDPLLTIEYHRHFSHSLAFIPIGGLIVALALFPFVRKHLAPAQLYLYATLGYATSGLLDACTSYGTQLFWPFSDLRVSWSIISIVDPLFTIPLLALVGLSVFKRSKRLARIAAIFSIAYLTFGAFQNHRASSFQNQVIAERQHASATRLTVKPSIANLVLWRSIYLHEGRYYVDALRVGFFSENTVYSGRDLPAFETANRLAALPASDPLAQDLSRFDHFSEGYLAQLPHEPSFITDLRYSALPNSIEPLWGLNMADTTATGHAAFETRRELTTAQRQEFKKMLLGK